jgi:hypothetical protein
MPEPIVMKFGMYIIIPKAIPMVYFTNPPISNTNTADPQIVDVITQILLEYLNRSS